jgi:lactate permease
MGKMIDAQSIMVASAACYDDPHERAHSLGPIFRRVWWHSVAGAAVIGIIALLQAYVFSSFIPVPPPK